VANLVEEEGVEPSFCWLQASGPPVERLPKLAITNPVFAIPSRKRYLALAWIGRYSVVEECLRRFRLALNLPYPGVRHLI
jgi:hypothetical protein